MIGGRHEVDHLNYGQPMVESPRTEMAYCIMLPHTHIRTGCLPNVFELIILACDEGR